MALELNLLLHDLSVDLPSGVRLQRLVATLRSALSCDAVALLALEPGEVPCLRPIAAVGLTRDALGRRFLPSEQPRLAAILATKGVVSFEADSRLADPYDGLIVGHQGQLLPVHGCMGIRIHQGGRPWGVLTVDSLQAGRLSNTDREALGDMTLLVEAAVRVSRLEQENRELRHARARAARAREDAPSLPMLSGEDWEIVAQSAVMRSLLDESRVVGRSDLPVLLLGETGVGKELLARRLHRLSPRADKALALINCAALPESLAESELFGHVRGAFSGAVQDRIGRVEAAQGGTLFLDEVGELPLTLQAKLLRTLQNGEIQRLGSDRTRKVDVRFIAATNRDLKAAVRDGRFRADLYHRLSVYPLPIPPLRERTDDILPLAGRFLEIHRARLGLRGLRLAPAAEKALQSYAWPGNVRELEHVIGRAALRACGILDDRYRIVSIGLDVLSLEVPPGSSRDDAPLSMNADEDENPGSAPSLRESARNAQRRSIRLALDAASGNWALAARRLKMDASNLHKLGRRLGLK